MTNTETFKVTKTSADRNIVGTNGKWKIRQGPSSEKCRCNFSSFLRRQNIPRAKLEKLLKLWAAFPRQNGRIIIPDLKFSGKHRDRGPALIPMGGGDPDYSFDDPDTLLDLLFDILLVWIDMLKKTDYVVEVLNSTEVPIAVVWTYLLNELTPSGDLITVGPFSSTWLGLSTGETATFSLSGCLYMKSYAITVVYDGNAEVVLPNSTVGDINEYELSEYGELNICSDWWEIYVE